MKKIRYYYSAMSKQVFLILMLLFVCARLILFSQVIKHNINNYAQIYNVKASMILYAIYISICVFFFFAYKFFVTEYDENKIVYYNKFIRKSYSAEFDKITKAVLNKRGIYLYYEAKTKEALFIPFFRFGVISPVGVDDFYRLMKSKGIVIEKTFKTLPGFGKSRKWISMIYSGLALLALAWLTQSAALINAIGR